MKDIQYSYFFVNMGSMVSSTAQEDFLRPKINRFFLDVGNKVMPGVIDHHVRSYNQGARSTASLILSHPYLVLENLDITDDITRIEIAVHKQPDFDCLASTYIVQKIIATNGCFEPEELAYLYSLVSYADQVDSGRILISRDRMESPLAICNAIDVVLEKNCSGLTGQDLSNKVFRRGLELVTYVVDRMKQCAVNDPEAPGLFPYIHPFQAQVELLKEDYLLYLQDMEELKGSENREFHPIVEIFLPSDQDSSQLEAVSALFWRNIPRCILHKHWARGDLLNDPWGRGFTFTFIPASLNPDALKSAGKEKLAEEHHLQLSRAIISVKPDSGITLKGLGDALEKAEQEAQARQFPDNFDAWRSSNNPTPGYDIEDPWYDGAAHNYTIIDAPARGSLLSLDEIRAVTLKAFHPEVEQVYTRLIIPFQFKNEQYSIICKNIESCNSCSNNASAMNEEDKSDYFLPYIRKYIFGNRANVPNNNEPERYYCRWFHIDTIDTDDECSKYIKVLNVNLVIFRYGIGFIIIDTRPVDAQKVRLFKQLLSYNRVLRNKSKDFFDQYLPASINAQVCRDPVSYLQVFAAINSRTLPKKEIPKMIYKLCSVGRWKDAYHNSDFVNDILKDLILDLNENAIYGFGKAASGFLHISDPNHDLNIEAMMSEFTNSTKIHDNETLRSIQKFWTVHFMILLLALQQRKALMKMASDLALFSENRIHKRKIPGLRQNFLEFMTQGWFSQISESQIEMEIFHRWQKTFNINELHEEVTDQLQSVDEYSQASLSHTLNTVSLFVFPVMFLSAVLTVLLYAVDVPSRWTSLATNPVWAGFLEAGAFVFLILFVLVFRKLLGRRERRESKK